jgi:starch phosphorylase
VARLSIFEEEGERYIRMANLACIGSRAINGVAQLHSDLLKQTVLKDFHDLWPEKFFNVTNGVTPRRFLLLSNPRQADLISRRIGTGWARDLEQLRQLEPAAEDSTFRQEWREIKRRNKETLARLVLKRTGVTVDPDSLFDVQFKRMHEYKRQHLNVLHVITLYQRLRENPDLEIVPRTFLFGGKAAPGYRIAKLMIKLIHAVGEVVNHDPVVRDRLKVVFFPNFNVKNAQHIYPAGDLSEQISTAGLEASGTGNMKFALNGALTIGTLDGANIEIPEHVGAENFFLFGLTEEEVREGKSGGYRPHDCYEANEELRGVLDLLRSGFFSPDQPDLFRSFVDSLLHRDDYMLLADYASYLECQAEVSAAYQDEERWSRMSILNVARMGYFSSDRSIRDYCERIWDVKPKL